MFSIIYRRSFIIFLFLAWLFIVGINNSGKQEINFYVALNGNDKNPGTFEKPWATINHAAEVLKSGETVYIRGGKYQINQQIKPKNSGLQNSWIVYSSYHNEQVVIDANDVKVAPPFGNPPYPHDQGAFQVEKVSYIRIKRLKITNSHNAGFTIRDSNHIELYNNITQTTFSSGIAIWDTNRDGEGCERNKIIGNTIIKANTYDMIIPGYSKEGETPHEAISVGGAYYFEVAYNHVYDSDKEGIDIKETSRHGTVHHNYIHNLSRQGLYVDNHGDLLEDIEIFSNIVHDCKGAGIVLSVENGHSAQDIKIHHNLIYNNLGAGIFFSRWGDGPRKNIKIYNNTIHHNGYGKPNPGDTYYWITGGLYLFSTNLQNLEIKNNIFSENKGFQIGYSNYYLEENNNIDSVFRQKQINIAYNLLFDLNKVNYPIYVGWSPNDYVNVYPAKGKKFIEKNPLFLEPQQGNFALSKNSPAIDQGSPEQNYLDTDRTRNDLGAFSSGTEQRIWWKTNFPPNFDEITSQK